MVDALDEGRSSSIQGILLVYQRKLWDEPHEKCDGSSKKKDKTHVTKNILLIFGDILSTHKVYPLSLVMLSKPFEDKKVRKLAVSFQN